MDGIASSSIGNPAQHGVLVSAGPGTIGANSIVPGTAGYVLTSTGPNSDPVWTLFSGGSGGIPEAPNDTHVYGRGQQSWLPLDSYFFSINGGTVFGTTAIHSPAPALVLIPTGDVQPVVLSGTDENQVSRWAIFLNDGSAETGGNTGSNFAIARYTDAGAFVDAPLAINRQTGVTTFNQNVSMTAVGPTLPTQLATKKYVDDTVAAGSFLPLTGGTITGDLVISAPNPALRLNSTGGGPDFLVMSRNSLVRWSFMTQGAEVGGNSGSNIGMTRFADNGAGIDNVFNISRATGEMSVTHPFTLAGDPTLPLHAATKQYVDAKTTGFGTGNVSNFGAPTNGQLAQWTDSTHITGVAASSLGFQPLDADLTSLAAASAVNAIYYRSAANTWGPVTIGANLTFVGGTLSATGGGGGGDVFLAGTNPFTGLNTFVTQPVVVGANAAGDATVGSSLQVVNVENQTYKFSNDALGPIIRMRKSRSGTVGNNTIVQNLDTLGSIQFAGADGSVYVIGAIIQCSVDGVPGAGNLPTNLTFSTRPGAGGVTTHWSLFSSGYSIIDKVGGQQPSHDPAGDSAIAINGGRVSNFSWTNDTGLPGMYLRKSRGGSPGLHGVTLDGDGAQINSSGNDGTAFVGMCAINMLQDGAASAGNVPGKIAFSTRQSGAGNLPKMTIWSTGIVQIATNPTVPFAFGGRLQVVAAAGEIGQITLDGVTGGQSTIQATNWQAAAGSAFLNLRHTRGGAVGTFGALLANDPIGGVQFWGTNATAFTSTVNAAIACQVENDVGAADSFINTRLTFSVSRGGAPTEKMRLTGQGCLNVGSANIGLDPGAGIIACSGIWGVPDATAPSTGVVGENILSSRVTSSGTLTVGTIVNYHNINLAGGDWDVWVHTTWVCASAGPGSAEMEFTTSTSAMSGTNTVYVITTLPSASNNADVNLLPMVIRVPGSGATYNLLIRAGAAHSVSNAYIVARRRR